MHYVSIQKIDPLPIILIIVAIELTKDKSIGGGPGADTTKAESLFEKKKKEKWLPAALTSMYLLCNYPKYRKSLQIILITLAIELTKDISTCCSWKANSADPYQNAP